jgi:hypothetical protein
MSMNFCQSPAPAITAILLAAARNKTLQGLYAYDHVRLQAGKDLEPLLEIIPAVHLLSLHINLDFDNEAVLSSFHLNTNIQHLYDENVEEIEGGHVADILERNYRLSKADLLLDCDNRIPAGLWAKGIEYLIRGDIDKNRGATAAYKILREKLVMWAPNTSSTKNTAIASPAAATPVPAAAGMPSSNSTVKRLHALALMENGDEKTEAKSSSSSSLEPQQKRQRGPLSPPRYFDSESSTTATAMMMMDDIDTRSSIDSLSREELKGIIKQQRKKKIDMLVNANKST